jgi:hypothetical protein
MPTRQADSLSIKVEPLEVVVEEEADGEAPGEAAD